MKVVDLIRIVTDDCNIKVVEEWKSWDCPIPNNHEWDCSDCTYWDDEEFCCNYGGCEDGRIERVDYHSIYTGRGDDVPIKIADKVIRKIWVEDVTTHGKHNKAIHTTYLIINVEE